MKSALGGLNAGLVPLVLFFPPLDVQTDNALGQMGCGGGDCEYQYSGTFLSFQLLKEHQLIWTKVSPSS